VATTPGQFDLPGVVAAPGPMTRPPHNQMLRIESGGSLPERAQGYALVGSLRPRASVQGLDDGPSLDGLTTEFWVHGGSCTEYGNEKSKSSRAFV